MQQALNRKMNSATPQSDAANLTATKVNIAKWNPFSQVGINKENPAPSNPSTAIQMGDYTSTPNLKPNISNKAISPVASDINKAASTEANDITGIGAAVSGATAKDNLMNFIKANQTPSTTTPTTTPTTEVTTTATPAAPSFTLPDNSKTLGDAYSEYMKMVTPDAATQKAMQDARNQMANISGWETSEQAYNRMRKESWAEAVQGRISQSDKLLQEQNKGLEAALEYAPKNLYGTLTGQELTQLRTRNSRDFIKNINDLTSIRSNSVNELNAINSNIENVLKLRQQDRENKMNDIKARLDALGNAISPEQKNIALLKLQQKIQSVNNQEQSALDTAKQIAIEAAKRAPSVQQAVWQTRKTYTDNDIALLWSVTKLDKQWKETLAENGFSEQDWANYNAWLLPATTQQKQEAANVVEKIDDIMSWDWTNAVGTLKWLPVAGTDRTNFEKKINALKDTLAMANLWKLKGPMSDRDIEFLRSTSTYLSQDLSEDEFEKAIMWLRDVYAQKILWSWGATWGWRIK